MSFVTELREELVAAAEREQVRRLPRIAAPARHTLLAVTAAAALVLIVVLAAGSLNTGPPEEPPAVASPTPDARELFGGTLEPGVRYRTRELVPAISFELPKGRWAATDTARPDLLVIDHGQGYFEPDGERRPPPALSFGRVTEVYDPAVPGLRASLTTAPADLHAWLRSHPDLRVGRAEPVTVAGVPGVQFPVEVAFRRPTHPDPECRRRFQVTCTAITPNGSFQDGTLMRLTIVRTEPEPLVIAVDHFTRAGLRDMEEAAAPVLKSLRIGVR